MLYATTDGPRNDNFFLDAVLRRLKIRLGARGTNENVEWLCLQLSSRVGRRFFFIQMFPTMRNQFNKYLSLSYITLGLSCVYKCNR